MRRVILPWAEVFRLAAVVVVAWGVSCTTQRGCVKPNPVPDPAPPSDIAIVGADTVEMCAPLDLTVDTKGAIVDWIAPDSKDCWLRPTQVDGKGATFFARREDRYRLVAHSSVNGRSVADTKWVTVGKPAPIPPGPNPIPPGPGPTPGPLDEFQKALGDAYAKDTDSDKATCVAVMGAIYKAVGHDSNNPRFATAGDFAKTVNDALSVPGLGIRKEAIPNIRKAVGTELNKVLANMAPNKPLDQSTRDLIGSQFVRIGTALGGLK